MTDADELAAVTACIADYCEGYAAGDEQRMERSLHPELVKRSIEGDSIRTLDAPYMVRAAAKRRADGTAEVAPSWTIELVDIRGDIAAAVVVTANSRTICTWAGSTVNGKSSMSSGPGPEPVAEAIMKGIP